jgi:hypothetical protein
MMRKLEDLEKHKRRIFSYDGQTNFWVFVGLIFSLIKIFMGKPPSFSDLSITGGHQQFEEEFRGVVGAVGSLWMVQS